MYSRNFSSLNTTVARCVLLLICICLSTAYCEAITPSSTSKTLSSDDLRRVGNLYFDSGEPAGIIYVNTAIDGGRLGVWLFSVGFFPCEHGSAQFRYCPIFDGPLNLLLNRTNKTWAVVVDSCSRASTGEDHWFQPPSCSSEEVPGMSGYIEHF